MFNDSLHKTQISIFTSNSSDSFESAEGRSESEFKLDSVSLVCSEILEPEIMPKQDEEEAKIQPRSTNHQSSEHDDMQSPSNHLKISEAIDPLPVPKTVEQNLSRNTGLDDHSSFPQPIPYQSYSKLSTSKLRQSLSLLLFEFPEEIFRSMLPALHLEYSTFRKVRQDSFSYLRAVGISYLEYLFGSNSAIELVDNFLFLLSSDASFSFNIPGESNERFIEFLNILSRAKKRCENVSEMLNLLMILDEFDESLIEALKIVVKRNNPGIIDFENRSLVLIQALCNSLRINIKNVSLLGVEEFYSEIRSEVKIAILINRDSCYCLYNDDTYPSSPSQLQCKLCNTYQDPSLFPQSPCSCPICTTCYSDLHHSNIKECPLCLTPFPHSISCILCNQPVSDYVSAHSCEVPICLDCFRLQIEEQIINLSPKLICYQCKSEIFPEFYEKFISKSDLDLYHSNLIQETAHKTYPCMQCGKFLYRDEMLTLACEHYFCESCISSYINYIISTKTFNSKGIYCLKCHELIDFLIIKQHCTPSTYDSFCKQRMSRMTTTIKCPRCRSKFFRLQSDSKCPNCKQQVCYRCSGIWHEGVCNIRNVMNLYTYMMYNMAPCPDCSTYNYTFIGKDERVICINPECGKVYLICCSVSYSSILAHGPGRHKTHCKNRRKKCKQVYMPDKCEECKKLGKFCYKKE